MRIVRRQLGDFSRRAIRLKKKDSQRFKPYTAIGIRRVPCARCGKPSHASWNVCADKVGSRTRYRGLCQECDVALNELAMRFVFGLSREDDIAAYRERVLGPTRPS